MPNEHLTAEMTLKINNPFYLTAVSWQNQQPVLRFQAQQDNSTTLVEAQNLFLRFRVITNQPRRCIGATKRTEEGSSHQECESEPTSGRYCDKCQTVENVNAANMHQAHRRGRAEIDKTMTAYLLHPHRLYLAAFRDGSIKVGTTRGSSGHTRLIEQGAWVATYVAEVEDGFAVRELEDEITEQLGVTQAVDTRRKILGHLHHLSDQELAQRLSQLSNETENVLRDKLDGRGSLIGERWSNPMIDTEVWSNLALYPGSIKEGAHELTINSMVGRLAACQKTGFANTFLVDTHSLLTLPLETGTFEVDELALQESLF